MKNKKIGIAAGRFTDLFAPMKKYAPIVKENCKIGRNDPCPCGATKEKLNRFNEPYNVPVKYKHCCLNKPS